ncbi:UvrB/UvrC motif-containing protein [Akkermansiaceae bacterium]|nr:UvrB/UvrC motif-containing protein [bacterium]MDB4261894.1 UvrB/UvrC motif-containing protein [Akkermansiaceae bacterium]MDB4299372.1 UvrB/UvrC motif-containing protein [bacterium]MDB4307157.1 UvrB/UvrC motif-containing protein [Akkermansiaceae bacterium]MDC0315177.1 UvrB/UvrC motif-containing protein [bacterium]
MLNKCDYCEKKATVFFTQVTEGKMKKTSLCESCAQQQGIADPNGLLMADQLMGSPVPQEQVGLEVFPLSEVVGECPTCAFTLEDYRKVGRLGCGDCYVAFGQEIEQRLPVLHKGFKHEGRSPAGLVEQEQRRSLVDGLNDRLQKAIASEDYEEAAKVRDELQAAVADQQEGEALS